jgi:hypothetical protein
MPFNNTETITKQKQKKKKKNSERNVTSNLNTRQSFKRGASFVNLYSSNHCCLLRRVNLSD